MTKTLLSYIGRSKHIERSKITKLLFDYIYVIIDRKKFFDFTKKIYLFGAVDDELFFLVEEIKNFDFTDISALSFDVDPDGVIRYYNRIGKIRCTISLSAACFFSDTDENIYAYNGNTGKNNNGYCNIGDYNIGDCNIGNSNTGENNIGSGNAGFCNVGKFNSGGHNTGTYNSGSWNKGCYNSGFFNTGRSSVYMFNKRTNKDPDNIEFPAFLYFSLTDWVKSEEATKQEKIEHKKEITVFGGFLKKLEYKEVFRDSYDKASQKEHEQLFALPNFDPFIFEEISGIDTTSEYAAWKKKKKRRTSADN